MTGLFCTPLKTLTFKPTLTQSVFRNQRNSLISRHALPQGGEKTSLELLEITRLFSRRSTCQLLAMTNVRPLLGPPGLHRCLGYRMWRGQHTRCLCLCVQGCLLDRLRHDLSVWPAERLLLELLGLLSSTVPDLDERRAQPTEPGGCRHAECRLPHWQEEGSCPGQGDQGSGDPQQVQPVQRLLAAHRCSPSDHRGQRICRWGRRRHFQL